MVVFVDKVMQVGRFQNSDLLKFKYEDFGDSADEKSSSRKVNQN